MPRPVTLFTGQWADLPFEEMCRLASEWGYDGLEIACWGDHFEVDKAVDPGTGDEVTGVSAISETFVRERPLAGGSAGEGRATGTVTVDDAVVFAGRLASGALASFEVTRCAAGRKNGLRLELNGSAGSLAFDLERLNELEFFDASDDSAGSGFRRILVTEGSHPYLSGWWPPGHTLGWEHTFTHQARDLLTAIAAGDQPTPSFADGLAVQRVLDAVARSAASGNSWESVH